MTKEAMQGSFDTSGVDDRRRRFLTATTTVIGAAGVVGLARVFLGSMSPSARARAAGAPVEVDVSQMDVGQLVTVEWRGQPVWIVRRSQEALASLDEVASQLADPDSDVPQQPEYAQNPTRSIRPEYMVMVGVCTHLGCSPTFRPEVAAPDLGASWKGGFFCPCHGSKFDYAGRVYSGAPAPTNLVVPPYRYAADTLIVVGEDPRSA